MIWHRRQNMQVLWNILFCSFSLSFVTPFLWLSLSVLLSVPLSLALHNFSSCEVLWMTLVFERCCITTVALLCLFSCTVSNSLSSVCPQLLPFEQADWLPDHQGEHSIRHLQLPGARLWRPLARRRLLRHRPRQGAARRGHPQLRLAAHGRYVRDLSPQGLSEAHFRLGCMSLILGAPSLVRVTRAVFPVNMPCQHLWGPCAGTGGCGLAGWTQACFMEACQHDVRWPWE